MKITITITDLDDGQVNISCDLGDGINEDTEMTPALCVLQEFLDAVNGVTESKTTYVHTNNGVMHV
jgi:hypothetical protein